MRYINSIFPLVAFLLCVSCGGPVSLSSFTKDVIDEYISSSSNKGVVIISQEDSYYWYLKITSIQASRMFAKDLFIGRTYYNNYPVDVYGFSNNLFFSVPKESSHNKTYGLSQRQPGDIVQQDDPSFWQIAIKKDTTFSKYKSYIIDKQTDIAAIECVSNKYFRNSKWDEEVFEWDEVEQLAQPSLGVNGIRDLIKQNYHKTYVGSQTIPIIIDLIVDYEGNAIISGLIKRTDDTELNNEALRVANIICRTKFIPATIRGQSVNSKYSIPFLRIDISASR